MPPVGWPPTRFAEWRVRSRVARLIDEIVGAAGLILLTMALLDAVCSLWNNEVLIYPGRLEFIAGALLLPSWPWIIASAWMVNGTPRRDRSGVLAHWRSADWKRLSPFAIGAGVVALVVVLGFVEGAAKGSLRVLRGDVYQVSTSGLNDADWTTVSRSTYQLWAARFVREDALFGIFALAMLGFRFYISGIRSAQRGGDRPVQ